MSPRRRVGVVVVVDPPAGDWVDGLRRAVGDPAIGRIAPHVTLVPPLNLRPGDLDAALERLHAAAATVGPLRLALGPPGTFLPANPVLHLGVSGDVDGLRTLRDAVFAPPLERSLTWPWVPHVTLADDLDPDRIAGVVEHLERFAVVAEVERVTMLEEHHGEPGRRWEALTDAFLGPAAVVGCGGLELRLVAGRTPEPASAGLLGDIPLDAALDRRLIVTARREGATVGAAAAWRNDDGGHVRVVVDPAHRGGGIGTHLLAGVEDAVRRDGWHCGRLAAEGPAGFYSARSAWSVA